MRKDEVGGHLLCGARFSEQQRHSCRLVRICRHECRRCTLKRAPHRAANIPGRLRTLRAAEVQLHCVTTEDSGTFTNPLSVPMYKMPPRASTAVTFCEGRPRVK